MIKIPDDMKNTILTDENSTVLKCDICNVKYYEFNDVVGTTKFNCCSLECERASWTPQGE